MLTIFAWIQFTFAVLVWMLVILTGEDAPHYKLTFWQAGFCTLFTFILLLVSYGVD